MVSLRRRGPLSWTAVGPYLKTLRPHGFGMTLRILQIIAQLLVPSWDNGWDNRRGSTRDRIALKRRQRNDLVGFELFFVARRSIQLSYGRAAKHFTVNSLRQVLLRFQPRVLAHYELVKNRRVRYLSHTKK